MQFIVKDMDINTGGPLIAILNEKDAEALDVRHEDRIKVKFKNKETVSILDISESDKAVPQGYIGLFEEVLDKLKVRDGDIVDFELTSKPDSVSYIREKLQGKMLTYNKFYKIVDDISNDRLTDIEKTYFVAGTYSQGMCMKEIADLTKSIVNTGQQIHFNRPVFDKHCAGGVPGNRTTMCVVPIVAATGLLIPKTSSRAITSPAGTADTMEVLANVTITSHRLKRVVNQINGCIVWGGSMNLAPADDKIIEVEHPLALDVEGQMLASVMAKKASVGSTNVLIDIPVGPNVKCRTKTQAMHLKHMFEVLAHKLHMKPRILTTDGTQPIGYGVGPVLEARDVLAVLRNDENAPSDLRKKSLLLASNILEMGGVKNSDKVANEILGSGRAFKKMKEIIHAQGEQEKKYLPGKLSFDFLSQKSGKVIEINNSFVNKLARIAGAPADKGAGLFVEKKVGDKVNKGDVLFRIFAESEFKLSVANVFVAKNMIYRIK